MSLIPCRDCTSPRCEGCNTYTLSQMLHKGGFDCLMDSNKAIRDQEIAPVKHGEWLEVYEPCGWTDIACVQCSACGDAITLGEWDYEAFCREIHYCPNCGAKM